MNSKLQLFFIATFVNIIAWYLIAKWHNYQQTQSCLEYFESQVVSEVCNTGESPSSICGTQIVGQLPRFRPLLTRGFVRYKADSLVNVRYPEWSILLQPQNTHKCNVIVNPHASRKRQYSCLGVVTVNSDSTYNLLRFDKNQVDQEQAPHKDTALLNVTGFFTNVANHNGRRKIGEKLGKLLQGLPSLEDYVLRKLAKRSLYPGEADVAVMVVNDGEIDLFANFACSCRAHNISMRNVLVFAGSEEVVPLIESMGAMGLYHESTFASVSRNASYEYLDPIFIDMMWYKSFSVWLLLKLRFNVLFQDVDLVWYRDPVQYFRRASTGEYQQSHHQQQQQQQHGAFESATVLASQLFSIGSNSNKMNMNRRNAQRSRGRTLLSTTNQHHQQMPDRLLDAATASSKLQRGPRSDGAKRRLSQTGAAEFLSRFGFGGSADQQVEVYDDEQPEQIISSVHHDSWGNRLLTLPPADAYLSDDGQRSLRYTPFFANSGFYYLVANDKTVNFAWGIVTAFDLLHRTGSHQNVFTIRLIESLDLGNLRPKLLSLREFPAGVKFHHDKPYMRAIKDGHEHPFVFHMYADSA